MVGGTRDLAATSAFYQEKLGNKLACPYPYQIDALSQAYKAPVATSYNISLAQMPSQFLLELEQYPLEGPNGELIELINTQPQGEIQ